MRADVGSFLGMCSHVSGGDSQWLDPLDLTADQKKIKKLTA